MTNYRWVLPTSVTFAILVLGVSSIFRVIQGDMIAAAQFIVLAAILDGLDGELARLSKGITDFGKRLDMYVDAISFGVAPAVLIYDVMWSDFPALGWFIAITIVCAGVIRFSRDEVVSDVGGSQHTFRGLPIPVCAIWVGMFVLLMESDVWAGGSDSFLRQIPLPQIMWPLIFASLVLQVSNIPYVKPSKELVGLALALTVLGMLITHRPAMAFALGTCASMLAFMVIGPALVRHQTIHDDSDSEEPISVQR